MSSRRWKRIALYEAIRMFAGREDEGRRRSRSRRSRARRLARRRARAEPQSPARRGAAVSRDAARRATTASALVAEPGDRRGARALPLVRRDRTDGADAPATAPPPINDDPLRPNELDYVIDGALSSNGEQVPDQRPPARSDALCDAGVERPLRACPVDELHRVDEVVTAHDRRTDRSGDPVHRGPAEAAREDRRDRPAAARDAADLQHGAREVRRGRRRSSSEALEIEPDNADGTARGRPTGTCPTSARAGPRMRRASLRSPRSYACARSRSIRTMPRRSGSMRTSARSRRRISTQRCTTSTARSGSIRTSPSSGR